MRAVGSQTSVIMRQEFAWGDKHPVDEATHNHLIAIRNCTLGSSKNTFQSETITAERAVMGLGDGNKAVQGSISMDLLPEGQEIFFRHLLGSDGLTTTGTDPYTHTIKGVAGTYEGLSIEKGFTNIGQYFLYTGCRVNSCSIDIIQEGFHGVTFDFVGKGETLTQATMAADGTNTTTDSGYTGYQCTVSVGGNVQENVISGAINISNSIETDGYVLGSQDRASAEYQQRTCSGEFVLFFTDEDLYNLYIAGTEVEVIFTFTSGADSLTITFPACKMSGESPNIDSTAGVNLSLKFEAKYDATDTTDVIFEFVNSASAIEEPPTHAVTWTPA